MRNTVVLVLALITLVACHTLDTPPLTPDLSTVRSSATAVLDSRYVASPDGVLTAWGEWHVPDEYEIWLAEEGVPPRLLVIMPIAPTLTTPSLKWEDSSHILHIQTSVGGGSIVTHTWRISLDGSVEEVSKEIDRISGG